MGSSKHIDKTKHNSFNINSTEDLRDNGFVICDELENGSHSTVKTAFYKGKILAVKILTRSELSDLFRTHFLPKEIEILSEVNHENIIQVWNIYSYPKHVFIFMEYIPTGTLLSLVKKQVRLSELEAHQIFDQLISAVQYLHSLNIAHRDLKCENVMLTKERVVKLVDFGFSTRAVDSNGRRKLSHSMCGSLGYTPPEVLLSVPYNPMFYDIWSLGCVLFIMITGNMPFDSSADFWEITEAQINKDFEYPLDMTPSKSIKKLISSMLEPDLLKRFNIRRVSNSKWIKENRRYLKSNDSGVAVATSCSCNS